MGLSPRSPFVRSARWAVRSELGRFLARDTKSRRVERLHRRVKLPASVVERLHRRLERERIRQAARMETTAAIRTSRLGETIRVGPSSNLLAVLNAD